MTVQNSQDRTATGQTTAAPVVPKVIRSLPRDHTDYWRGKLKKRRYADRGGHLVEVPEWQVRVFHAGKEGWFNLDTANRGAAAVKARDIYVHLRNHGWDDTLAKFKPKGEEKLDVTVGEFLEQVQAVSGLNPTTFAIYARKFRRLVSDAFGVKGGNEKYDYVNGGYKNWLAKVHGVKLDKLSPERINDWKVKALKAASKNPLALKHANVTLRSILLGSKALFSPKVRKHLTLKLPTPLPFEGVSLPEIGKSRYKSEIDPALLLTAAKRELAEGDQGKGKPGHPRPELFKIVLLALGAGLRRDEIDTLQWKQIQWHRNAITIETTEHGSTKSADSEADVDVDPGLLDILKTYLPKPGQGTPFVIQSPVQPRPEATSYHHYRCDRLFKETVEWLRGKGIRARTALHSLRKEFGSQICAQGGIYAASVALRHSSINITREHYVDKKQAVVFQVARLLRATDPETEGQPLTEATGNVR